MKKQQLLLLAALAASSYAAAQTQLKPQCGDVTPDVRATLNLNEDGKTKTTLPDPNDADHKNDKSVKVLSTANVDLYCGADQYIKADGISDVLLNGEGVITKSGMQGQTNPVITGDGFGRGNATKMEKAFFQANIKGGTDGISGVLYVVHKASANKAYGVIEGQDSGTGYLGRQCGFQHNVVSNDMPVTDAVTVSDGNKVDGKVQVLHCTAYQYNQPYNDDGDGLNWMFTDQFEVGDQNMPCWMAQEMWTPSQDGKNLYASTKYSPGTHNVGVMCFEKTSYANSDNKGFGKFKESMLYSKGTAANGDVKENLGDCTKDEFNPDKTDKYLGDATIMSTDNVYRLGLLTYSADKTGAAMTEAYSADNCGFNKKYQQNEVNVTVEEAVEADAANNVAAKPAVKVAVYEFNEMYADIAQGTLADNLVADYFTKDATTGVWTLNAASTAKPQTALWREAKKSYTAPPVPDAAMTEDEFAAWFTKYPVASETEFTERVGKSRAEATQADIYKACKDKKIYQVKVPMLLTTSPTDGTGELVQRNGLPAAKSIASGTGILRFKAYKGNKYQFCAAGSKMTLEGFIFIPCQKGMAEQKVCLVVKESADASGKKVPFLLYSEKITWPQDGNITIEPLTEAELKDASGYSDLSQLRGADFAVHDQTLDDTSSKPSPLALRTIKQLKQDDPNAPIYNLQGQVVGKGYKGIAIQNGKKFLVK